MTDSDEPVISSLSNGVLTLTLNRPDRGNGWTGPLNRAYFSLLDQAARSPEVRVIVVTGAGKAFCVGGDSEVLGEIAGGNEAANAPAGGGPRAWKHWFPLTVGKPIIAAINGACFGIGLQQALCADIRFASDEAKFSTAYARRGLVAEMGMSWLLPRLVGTGHALDLMLSARLVRAPEAERMGLVNRVVPSAELMTEAQAYAEQLAQLCSPSAMRTIKEQVWRDLTASLNDAYDRSEDLLGEAFRGEDFKEGMRSWSEGRAPHFPSLAEAAAIIDYADLG
jgi:enoyl-CoA hydratase/carnithine racemase